MSWLFSQALAEDYWPDTSSGGAPSAPLNVMPTPHKFWHRDKTMDGSQLSRYGLTCRRLTQRRGEALLMSYLEASRARTSASQERELVCPERGQDSGFTWPVSFASLERGSSTWKIPNSLLDGDSASFSQTWPRWGSMRSGESYRQKTAVPLTAASAVGSWPTPRAVEGLKGGICGPHRAKTHDQSLVEAVSCAMFPTPRATDGSHGGRVTPRKGREGGNLIEEVSRQMFPTPNVPNGGRQMKREDFERGGYTEDGKKRQIGLETLVRFYPTPMASDWKSGRTSEATAAKNSRPLREAVMYPTPMTVAGNATGRLDEWGGKSAREKMHANLPQEDVTGLLSPDWVEWLMGWPIGWSALRPLGTDRFLEWRRQHGNYSLKG